MLLTALLISRLFWEPYWIPAGSMKPALQVGDYIAAVPAKGGFERGSIYVFQHPLTGQDFVKRLIGMPGDRIQMLDGRLHLNDVPVEVEDVDIFIETMKPQGPLGILPQCTNAPVGIGEICEKDAQIETLPNGRQHQILNIGDSGSDHSGVFVVSESHYFFLGDNRDNSLDSRFHQSAGGFGVVPEENIHSRVVRVILPEWSDRSWLITALTNPRFMERIR